MDYKQQAKAGPIYGTGLQPAGEPVDTIQARLDHICATVEQCHGIVSVIEDRLEPGPSGGGPEVAGGQMERVMVAMPSGISAKVMRLTQQAEGLRKRLEGVANRLEG